MQCRNSIKIKASTRHAVPIVIVMSLLGASPALSKGGAALAALTCSKTPLASDCSTQSLSLYVGPQSVAPGEVLHIAVETQTERGASSAAKAVVIVDESTGRTYEAPVKNGLAHLDIAAPRRAGRITFRAEVDGQAAGPISNVAEVLVHPGRPTDFELFVEKDRHRVFVFSSLITDGFGNLINDGRIAELAVMHGSKIASTRSVRLQNGRVGVHLPCDVFAGGQGYVRVKLGAAMQSLRVPDYMCGRAA